MEDNFILLAKELERVGLKWVPEIGDEVSIRDLCDNKISILIDSNGMNLIELRENYIWLPTIEQLLDEIETRGGFLFHSGMELSENNKKYSVVIQTLTDTFTVHHNTLRGALAVALKKLILLGLDSKIS